MGSLINDVTQIWALDNSLCHASMPEACTYVKKEYNQPPLCVTSFIDGSCAVCRIGLNYSTKLSK